MLRRAFTAAALACAATASAVLVQAMPAQARACTINHYCYTTWYSNASRTVVVGQLFEDCDGARSMWGVRTAYLTFSENNC